MTHPAETWHDAEADAEAVARVLATLDSAEWTVHRDVRWPTREFASIDHGVVGPKGVFVIDSLGWSGRVNVANDQIRLNGCIRDSELVGAGEAAAAVTELIGLGVRDVQPVLCFVREEWLTGTARDVLVCSTSNLDTMLLGRSARLRPAQIRAANHGLDLWQRASERSVRPTLAASVTPMSGRTVPLSLVIVGAALLAVLVLGVLLLGA